MTIPTPNISSRRWRQSDRRRFARKPGRLQEHLLYEPVGAHKRDRRRCLDAGMDDFAAKPLDPDALPRLLTRWTRWRPGSIRSGISARSIAR